MPSFSKVLVMLRAKNLRRRTAAAAVELAVVLPLAILPMLFGLWEIGRLVQVQQIVSNAAREGARLAAQARTINRTGSPTEIRSAIDPAVNTDASPNVKATVMQSMAAGGITGIDWSDVDVTFEFLDRPAGAPAGPGDSNPQPHQAVKNQRFRVVVVLRNYTKTTPIRFGVVQDAQTIRESVEWRHLVNPLQTNRDISHATQHEPI
jgi:Flp pilus assembly protein TadG